METQRFVRPPEGGFGVGCASVFLGLPALGFAGAAVTNGVLWAAPIPLVLFAAALAAVYVWLNEEVVATLDARGLRLSRARVLLGVRLRETVDWELPLEALVQAREVTTRTPAKNGGWNERTMLQLPEGRAIDATALGGHESSTTAYAQLVRALRARLGSAFEVVTPGT